MASLTSTNSVFILTAEGIYAGVRVEGFASDDAFTFSTTEIGAGFMGVDGKFSTAYTPAPCPQDITLQADSSSIDIFDTIYAYTKTQRERVPLAGVITVTSTGKSYTLSNGVLVNYTPLSDHKRTLQPQRFQIVWGDVSPAKI